MNQHDYAISLEKYVHSLKSETFNEATTRSRIIDSIIYDVLSWPKNSVVAEEHNAEGYCDYILKDINNTNILVIEAKKSGDYFEIPKINIKNYYKIIKVKTLMTNESINNAMMQARRYCLETGTRYGCISNGLTWIFFTAFSQNWQDLNAFIISDIKYFSQNFTEAYNTFSYDYLVKRNSLSFILENKFKKNRISYSVKDKINAYSVPVDLNLYAQYLSKVIKYYFGDFDEKDAEFLKHCYVDDSYFSNTKNTLKNLFIDNASPYLENHGVINYDRTKLSQKLSKKISNFIDYSDNKHIVIIYGDRGSGKTTFIKKLIYFDIPEFVRNKLNIVYINLLDYAALENDLKSLKDKIWKDVINAIDVDNLKEKYDQIESVLFKDEFKTYRQQLARLYSPNSDLFGQRIESKIIELTNDFQLFPQRLAAHLRDNLKKEIVLVLDNTDQFSAEVQDFCFQVASEIFSNIKCLSIITIREERFFRSKNLGVLDAYETTQYHISSPQTEKVFSQRLSYLLESLDDDQFFSSLLKNHEIVQKNKEWVTRSNIQKFLIVFKKDFDKKLNLYTFLSSCAQKDMRKALEMFRDFIVSGYLNIYEILTKSNIFTLQMHQVIKPLMTPKKYFYDEEASSVPNIYKVRSPENGSHFTSIRILNYLFSDKEQYLSLSVMKDKFISIFDMQDDFEKSITMLILYKLIEANIKIDYYTSDIEEIKITPYGAYFLEHLIHSFTYIDLITTDCSYHQESIANFILKSASEEYELFNNAQRGYRLINRVKKTNAFLKYLYEQEENELEEYGFTPEMIIIKGIITKYNDDLGYLKNSSIKQHYSDQIEKKELIEFFKTSYTLII